MSDMPSLELRTEAVRLWGIGATEQVERAIQSTEALATYLKDYEGMVSVDDFVQAALADLCEAFAYLRRAKATIQPIVDRRLAEEQER